jgi:hypothetical protein
VTPGAFNKICAHPMVVTWVIGAGVLTIAVVSYRSNAQAVISLFASWQGILCLLLCAVPLSGLGFYLGMFTVWPLIRVVCSRLNGAPLQIGDKVLILSGPRKGDIAEVYEIVVGQGGQKLARLNLGKERGERFADISDIFEEYSVLKIKGGDPCKSHKIVEF